MTTTWTIRRYKGEDLESLMAVFTASVHELGRYFYDHEQLNAWAPRPPDPAYWGKRFRELDTWVADAAGEIGGFIAFQGGHLDLLFVAPAHARQGLATRLYQTFVAEIREQGETQIRTEASRTARAFFERMGLRVVVEEVIQRQGVEIPRFRMAGPVPRG